MQFVRERGKCRRNARAQKAPGSGGPSKRGGVGGNEKKRDTERSDTPFIFCRSSKREDGSPSWARTNDPRINSPLLYRLSYRGVQEQNYIGVFGLWQAFLKKNFLGQGKNPRKSEKPRRKGLIGNDFQSEFKLTNLAKKNRMPRAGDMRLGSKSLRKALRALRRSTWRRIQRCGC